MKIFLIGFMGSGKTHWARLLSKKLGLTFYDLDTVIVEQEKKSVADIFAEKGEEYFRVREKEMLERIAEVIWLNTSIDVLTERLLRERKSRPLIRAVDESDLGRYIVRKLSERRMYYQQADVTVNEENITLDELILLLFQSEKPDRMKEEL